MFVKHIFLNGQMYAVLSSLEYENLLWQLKY